MASTRSPYPRAYRPFLTGLVVLFGITAMFGADPALADKGTEGQWTYSPLAAMDVRAMVSAEKGDGLWRALVVSQGGASAVVVEHFARGRLPAIDGRPHVQRRLERFSFGGGSLSFTGQVDRFADLRFESRALAFDVVAGRDVLRCRVPLYGKRAFIARCQSGVANAVTTPTAHTRPIPINWSWRPRITQACQQAFSSPTGRNVCLQTVADAPTDPGPTIAACAKHLSNETSILRCVETGVASKAPTAELIATCDDAMYGDNNAMSCLTMASRARWSASRSIIACDKAMYGDTHALECVDIATRSPWEMSATIARCAANSESDPATLSCLARAGSD